MFIMEKIGTVILAGKNGKKRKITSYKAYYMIERFVHFFQSRTRRSGLWQATHASFGCQCCASLGLHAAHTQCILLPPQTKKHLL
jgi:hypothetical protein